MEENQQKTTGVNSPVNAAPIVNSQAPSSSIPPAPETVSNNNVVVQSKPKSKLPKILLILIPIFILIIFAVVAFFVIDKLNTPAKVKEKASVSQPIFLELDKTNKKIAVYLKEDSSGSDADSIEREVVKGEELVKSAKKSRETLQENMQSVKIAALENYKKSINKYLSETDKLIVLADQNNLVGRAYVEPLNKYEKLQLDISGASTYLFTDPAKYVTTLNSAISQEEEIIQDLKKVKVEGKMQELHTSLISTFEAEVKFLTQMRDAVEDRNTSQIAAAEKELVESSQKSTKETNRLSDELDNDVDEITESLESLSEEIKTEYSGLKGQYNF